MTSPLLTRPDPPGPSLAHLWASVLDEIRRDPAVSPANFSTWLRETQLLELVGGDGSGAGPAPAGGEAPSVAGPASGTAAPVAGGPGAAGAVGPAGEAVEYVIGAPHAFARDRLARAFRPAIERALARCLSRPAVRVRFAVAEHAPPRTAAPAPAPPPSAALDPRYTFSRFVGGRGSEFAVAAARAVADNPALAYNPLCLYGQPGTGKTHLLQAIGNHILQRRPEARIVSLQGDGAAGRDGIGAQGAGGDLGQAVGVGLGGAALVLLDDVQRLPPAAGESLLRVLAGLQEASVQVVAAADRPPRELTSLDGRLRAWLQSGLVAGIGAPDFETRLALVRARAAALRATLSPAVLEVIARRAPSDARELEGVVTRVVAGAELTGMALTPEAVGTVLADLLGPAPAPARRRVTGEEVLLATAATFGVPMADLKGRRRDRETALPRQVAMYLMRHETGASLAEIGAELGGRDHSTVIHGCERVAGLIAGDARLRGYVDAARQLLAGRPQP